MRIKGGVSDKSLYCGTGVLEEKSTDIVKIG